MAERNIWRRRQRSCCKGKLRIMWSTRGQGRLSKDGNVLKQDQNTLKMVCYSVFLHVFFTNIIQSLSTTTLLFGARGTTFHLGHGATHVASRRFTCHIALVKLVLKPPELQVHNTSWGNHQALGHRLLLQPKNLRSRLLSHTLTRNQERR